MKPGLTPLTVMPAGPRLEREGPHQALDGSLGAAQHAVAPHRLKAVDAGNRHDAARPASHEGHGRLHGGDEGVDGDGEGEPDIALGLLGQRPEGGGGGAGDQDVGPAEGVGDALEHRPDMGRLGQIEGQGKSRRADALDGPHHFTSDLLAPAIRDHAVGAVAGQPKCDGPADAARAARDDGHAMPEGLADLLSAHEGALHRRGCPGDPGSLGP